MEEISERVKARLAVISAHLTSADPLESGSPAIERWTTSADINPPPHGSLKGALTVVDERTGKKYQVPVSDDGTVKAVDLKKISMGKEDKGIKLYDPGYLNTAPVRSSISYIDGDEGILRYRGYPIEEMAENSTFLEVAYLLMYGNLPSESQLSDWEFAVSQHSAVPQGVLDIIQSMPHDAHPMGVLVSAMSALSIFHPDANPALRGQDIYDSKQVRDKQIIRIIGKAPTIAAAAYLRMAGRPPVLPSGSLSYAENFLYMLDSMGNRSYKPNPRLARVLDILFILHAEHEMNCSTAAARHLASSGVDVYTAVAGAVGALYGPLHGGANEAVLKMLSEIGSVDNIPEFIEGVKNRALSSKHKQPLTVAVEKKIDRRIEKGKKFQVFPVSDDRFLVRGDTFECMVDLVRRTCSCGKFDLMKIPCRHAIKAAFSVGIQAHTLTDDMYTTASWRSIYEESINPISVPEDAWIVPSHVQKAKVLPPETRRAAGRRKKRRYETVEDKIRSSQGTQSSKRRKCSRCGIEGHNRSTCDRAI